MVWNCYDCITEGRCLAYKNNTPHPLYCLRNEKLNEIPHETFRKIETFPRYYISSLGRVKDSLTNAMLNLHLNIEGYVEVILEKGNKDLYYSLVHRIVTSYFVSKSAKKPVIDHKNRIKFDNRVVNLRYASHSENMRNTVKVRYKGIRKLKDGRQALLVKNGYRITWGLFGTKREAALAYNEIAKEHYGDYAYLNYVEPVGQGSLSRLLGAEYLSDV
jgi:hypothetical protein